jgi:hypothetical protein
LVSARNSENDRVLHRFPGDYLFVVWFPAGRPGVNVNNLLFARREGRIGPQILWL